MAQKMKSPPLLRRGRETGVSTGLSMGRTHVTALTDDLVDVLDARLLAPRDIVGLEQLQDHTL